MTEYISREDVLKKAKSSISVPADNEWDCGYNTAMAEMQEFIKHLTAADVQPVKQWVELHDRHPDTEGFYLVCDQYGECEVAEYLPDIKSWFTHKIKGEIRYWMPLPKPPKDGDAT